MFRLVTRFLAAVVMLLTASATAVATDDGTAWACPGPAWNGLSLLNGWQPGSTSYYGTGSPAWAIQDDIVYLSGSIVQPSGSSDEFAVLPPAARPASVLYMSVYTLSGSQGWIVIEPSGEMYAEGSPYSNAQGYTSLAAVSFPAATLVMQTVSLTNGWQSSQGQWNTGDPSFTVQNGVVYLSGSLSRPAGAQGTFAHFGDLPPGAKPTDHMYLAVYTFAGAVGDLSINPDGSMYAYFSGATQFTSLAGISFPAAATALSPLPLVNGWQSALTQYWYATAPAITVRNGIVYLSGSAVDMPATGPLLATLPEFARPSHTLYIQVTAGQSVTEKDTGTLLIEPDGTIQSYSFPSGNAQSYTSLDAVSFPLGS